ncbi:hypothetical protein Glove_318g30 [Diversispora epigaea]|uniref:BTB domain-containing protein n=1 Tax=Diversispora epigaea TaxID=1348612 RepID=A0A397HQ19_9GLOM|nr:hypothetical protein Glove_318g30 [Diversispora epigaea]
MALEFFDKYIYGGIVNLENTDTRFIFDLMLVANEFEFKELTNKLETLLIDTKASWLKTHFPLIYNTIFRIQKITIWSKENFLTLKNNEQIRLLEVYNPLAWVCNDNGYNSWMSTNDSFIFSLKNGNGNIQNSILSRVKNLQCAIINRCKNQRNHESKLELCHQAGNFSESKNLKEWNKENFITFTLKNTSYICYFHLSAEEISISIYYLLNPKRPVKSIILPARPLLVIELPSRTNEPKEHFSTIISEDNNIDLGYIGITCHWLTQDFQLIDLLLAIEQMPYPHTGETISDYIKAKITEFELENKILFNSEENNENNNKNLEKDSNINIKILQELFPLITYYELNKKKTEVMTHHALSKLNPLKKMHFLSSIRTLGLTLTPLMLYWK